MMPLPRTARWAVIFASLLLAACGSLPPLPFLATDTPTPTNTPTPTPTPEATPTPTIALGARQTVEAGGFSFRPPAGFQSRIQGFQGVISNRDDTILISMAGVTELQEDEIEPLDTMLANFVAAAAEDMVSLEAGEPFTLSVGTTGLEARAMDLTGEFLRAPIRGRAALVAPSPTQRLFVFAFAVEAPAPGRWQNEALPVVVAVLSSLEFSEPAAPGAECAMSDDETYGYTPANPVQVGGGAFNGPPRQRAYLDHLLGPNGEPIDYVRTGSVPAADSVLDRYEVIYPGLDEPLVLYLDQYRFAAPAAPVGLTCVGAFPLGSP